MYLTQAEYTNIKGHAPSGSFTADEYRASKHVQSLTHGRVDGMTAIPDAVKHLVADVVDILDNGRSALDASSGAVTSFNNDGYSESYGVAKDADYLAGLIADAARDYLAEETDDAGTPLLYLGVDR